MFSLHGDEDKHIFIVTFDLIVIGYLESLTYRSMMDVMMYDKDMFLSCYDQVN